MNAKFKREGKNLSTKMEFVTLFTNSNVAMDFLSSITCAFAMTYICTLI
jgi:ABC-type spermidine/putrescine transport system permease subunit I